MPGVVAVFTGADLADDFAAPLPCAWPVTADMKLPDTGRSRSTKCASPVTASRSSSRRRRRPPRTPPKRSSSTTTSCRWSSTSRTRRPTSTLVHSGPADELSYTWALVPDPAAVDAAFADAAHIVKERYVQQRLIPMAMEPRGVCVVPAAVRRRLHGLLVDADPPHPEDHHGDRHRHPRAPAPRRRAVGRRRLRIEAQRLRRGGAVPRRSRKRLGRPVRWNEDRRENALATAHGPRDDPGHRARGRRRRPHRRGARAPARRHGRVPAAGHAGDPAARRVPLPRRLRHPRVLVHVYGRVHEPDADRRVPWRRPSGSDVRDRARHRRARPQGRDRPGGDPPAQLHPDRQVPVRLRGRLVFDCGDYEPALDEALGSSATRTLRASRRAAGGGIHEAPRHRVLDLRRDVRPRAEPRARRAQLRGRRLGSGDGPRAAHGQGRRSSPARRRTARATRRRGR